MALNSMAQNNIINIGVAQMSSGINLAENLAIMEQYCQTAFEKNTAILSFPEICNLVDKDKTRARLQMSMPETDKSLKYAREWAKKYQLTLHLGSLALLNSANNKFHNRGYLINTQGDIVDYYDKIHLYDVNLPNGEIYRESDFFDAGKRIVKADVICDKVAISVGLTICYDVRFPLLFRKLCQKNAKIIFVPACFTALTGAAHWESLLRARAIENSCYIVAAAQNGILQDGRATFGHSMIIDPWGKILVNAGNQNGVFIAPFNADYIDEVRAQIPAATINDEQVLAH